MKNKKLKLEKETISRLQSSEMLQIRGGITSIGACCKSRNNPTQCTTTGTTSCAKEIQDIQ